MPSFLPLFYVCTSTLGTQFPVISSSIRFLPQHPRLRALFSGFRPHFLSADPDRRGLSWKRSGGQHELDGWTYGRLDDRSL